MLLGFDNDNRCIKTLQANPKYFKHKSVHADIRSIGRTDLLDMVCLKVGELDLLAGGPPCQGFSAQRTIGSDKDSRNLLVGHYAELIQWIKPRFFLLENVVGIGGKRGRSILEVFLTEMTQSGFYVHKAILDARDYGVPQRRRRVFVIGERIESNAAPTFKWPEKQQHRGPTVRETIGHLPPPPSQGLEHDKFPGHRADKISELNRQRLTALQGGQARTDLPQELLADCHRASADKIGHRNVYGRMSWDDVAPTITARFDSFTRGQFGHPEQIRTISLYEGQLLQTFPADFRFVGSKVDVARQIGNAIPPLVAKRLGESLIQAIRLKDRVNAQCDLSDLFAAI